MQKLNNVRPVDFSTFKRYSIYDPSRPNILKLYDLRQQIIYQNTAADSDANIILMKI